MNEFAPMYSGRERLRLILILSAILGPLSLILHFRFIPWISNYASYANCYRYGNVNGVELLFYGLFVMTPLSFALIVLALLGIRSLRIIRAGQDPLPGEKVLRKTRYRHGRAALLLPVMTIIILLLSIGMAVWGSFQVEKLTRHIPPCSEQQKSDLGINN